MLTLGTSSDLLRFVLLSYLQDLLNTKTNAISCIIQYRKAMHIDGLTKVGPGARKKWEVF